MNLKPIAALIAATYGQRRPNVQGFYRVLPPQLFIAYGASNSEGATPPGQEFWG